MVSNEEKMLKERIKHLLVNKNMTISDLTKDEALYKRLRRQINDEALVPYSTIYMLLYMFPDISADWLVMGEGAIKKSDHIAPKIYNHNEVHGSTAGGDINVGSRTIPVPQTIDAVKVQDMQAAMAAQAARIEELEKDKALYQGLLAAFTKK